VKEWSQLYIKAEKVDRFINELICLDAVLVYGGEFVKERAQMGITHMLNATWSMETPHPEASMDYLDLLHQTGHHLSGASNLRTLVHKVTHASRWTKSDESHTSEGKKPWKENKATRPRQQKHCNWAPGLTRPAETEHAKMQRNVPQCNDPTIGSHNHYHLSPNGIPSGNQRWYGPIYLVYT